MANVIDEIFDFATQQPVGNVVTVRLAMTTSELTRDNMVSYSEGILQYVPAKSIGMSLVSPFFIGSEVRQYFSNKRVEESAPFDSLQTDPLIIEIGRGTTILTPRYSVDIKSPKFGFSLSFEPQIDLATGVLTGALASSFVTITLCNKASTPPNLGPH